MGVCTNQGWASKALQRTGFIGSFQVDYTLNAIRANGRTASYFWMLRKQMYEGVSLKDIDRAYHPADLHHILELRASFKGKGGRYENRFRVKDPFSDDYATMRAAFTVIVDPFGTPLSAEGAMFDITPLTVNQNRPAASTIVLADYRRDRRGLLTKKI